MILRKAHEGEEVCLCFTPECRELQQLKTQLIRNLAPLLASSFIIHLDQHGPDEDCS